MGQGARPAVGVADGPRRAPARAAGRDRWAGREAPARRGTLREFLGKAMMPLSFRLYEVRGKSGRTLGYVLAREKGLETLFLDENEALVANAMPIKDAFGP